MRTRGMIRRATPEPAHDLWPRLRARLSHRQEVVELCLPDIGWREAAALASALALLAAVPDPLRLLLWSGML